LLENLLKRYHETNTLLKLQWSNSQCLNCKNRILNSDATQIIGLIFFQSKYSLNFSSIVLKISSSQTLKTTSERQWIIGLKFFPDKWFKILFLQSRQSWVAQRITKIKREDLISTRWIENAIYLIDRINRFSVPTSGVSATFLFSARKDQSQSGILLQKIVSHSKSYC